MRGISLELDHVLQCHQLRRYADTRYAQVFTRSILLRALRLCHMFQQTSHAANAANATTSQTCVADKRGCRRRCRRRLRRPRRRRLKSQCVIIPTIVDTPAAAGAEPAALL